MLYYVPVACLEGIWFTLSRASISLFGSVKICLSKLKSKVDTSVDILKYCNPRLSFTYTSNTTERGKVRKYE